MTRLRSLHPEPLLPPGKYRHYKGQFYEVIGTARHSETMETLVVYKPLYKSRASALWVRPLEMFTETVKAGGREVPRFEYVKKAR